MANYPDWVLKHKRKGTYINRVKDKYYLYAAHSERIPGTGKVRRVSDGYIGRITEKEGLILSKPKIKGSIEVLEYGREAVIFQLCYRFMESHALLSEDAAKMFFCAGILTYLHGRADAYLYGKSWVSLQFPGLLFSQTPSFEVERMVAKISSVLQDHFGEDLEQVMLLSGGLYKVQANRGWHMSEEHELLGHMRKRYGLIWEL